MIHVPLVIIESPWSGLGAGERALTYLRHCIRDSLARGEIPWASHAMLASTRALYEEDEEQRLEGLEVNRSMIQHHATLIAFYTDHGMSKGMVLARRWAGMYGKNFEERKIFE